MITTATPSSTPSTDTQVITLVTERFGFRYLRARKSENGMVNEPLLVPRLELVELLLRAVGRHRLRAALKRKK